MHIYGNNIESFRVKVKELGRVIQTYFCDSSIGLSNRQRQNKPSLKCNISHNSLQQRSSTLT